jgi:hypothetical protein
MLWANGFATINKGKKKKNTCLRRFDKGISGGAPIGKLLIFCGAEIGVISVFKDGFFL